MADEEEYELIPLSPIRRLERKVEIMEKRGTSQDILKEVMDIVRSNQEIVEDIVKVNSEMISRVSELANSVNMLMAKVNDFISRVEVAAGEEKEETTETTGAADKWAEIERRFSERLDKMEKRVNALLLSSMARQKLVARARP